MKQPIKGGLSPGVSIPATPELRKKLWKGHLWNPSYFVGTVGNVSDEVIGAYKSFFALRKNGHTRHHSPKFRRKSELSPLKYLQSGFSVNDHTLTLSLGSSREDRMKSIALKIEYRPGVDLSTARIKGVTITYDKHLGLKAHLVIETPPVAMAQEGLTVAVDLGETNLITAVFSDRTTIVYSGRQMKAVRRYWQKVRSKVIKARGLFFYLFWPVNPSIWYGYVLNGRPSLWRLRI